MGAHAYLARSSASRVFLHTQQFELRAVMHVEFSEPDGDIVPSLMLDLKCQVSLMLRASLRRA